MKPLEIAARFAAFTWYTNNRQAPSRTVQAEARQFAKENWQVFIPVAQEGWGRLLLHVAKVRQNPQQRSARMKHRTQRHMAAAG